MSTTVARRKSKLRASAWLAALGAVLFGGGFPSAASAHGPIDPIASSYLARVRTAPSGIDAKVIDGDQRMWLQVARGLTVVVLDYRGAPYLRFSPSGIDVNESSAMYYLNQTPVALVPPPTLTARTRPSWHAVSGGDAYDWHDGRLHALAAVALAPRATFVGSWRVPIIVDGRRAAITGGLWHAGHPSIVWFWPIAVVLACVLAGWRIHRPRLDWLLAKGLGVAALIGLSAATLTRELHGRPTVTVFHVIEIVAVLGFAGWALHRMLFVRHGYFLYFSIAMVALWQGAELIPTLLQGFVLAVGPPTAVRAAAVVSLAAGISLLPLVFRIAEEAEQPPAGDRQIDQLGAEDDNAWELA